MKLKDGFITYNTGDEHVTVSTGAKSLDFNGIIRSNPTAAVIIETLKNDVTVEDIIKAVLEEFDVTQEVACKDIMKMVSRLRSLGVLDE